MTKLKLKNYSNWMGKTRVKVGEKVIKLREERQLLGRCLVIQRSRPELVPRLEEIIGDYEMGVIPRSLFAVDGSLLLPADKSSLLHQIEALKPSQSTVPALADHTPVSRSENQMMTSTSNNKKPTVTTNKNPKTTTTCPHCRCHGYRPKPQENSCHDYN